MTEPTDRQAVVNLFRPSLLAWRARHRAEKAAQANKPEPAAPPKPQPVPHLSR